MSTRRSTSIQFLASTVVVFVALACAARAADPETGTVEGKVTLNGKPLAKGKVIFHLKDGNAITADLKDDGSYMAKDVPTGTLPVSIQGEGVPKKFTDRKTTPLTVEVKPGKSTADFELQN
jgi:hypothetical protein